MGVCGAGTSFTYIVYEREYIDSKAENKERKKQMRERDEGMHIFVFLPSGLRPV